MEVQNIEDRTLPIVQMLMSFLPFIDDEGGSKFQPLHSNMCDFLVFSCSVKCFFNRIDQSIYRLAIKKLLVWSAFKTNRDTLHHETGIVL